MSAVYSKAKAFELYKYYLALKQHFNSDYDYAKYNGKINASEHTFETRKDKFQFYKLTNKKHAKDLILANFLVDSKFWIGHINETHCEEIYNEWRKRIDSLSYVFRNDLTKLEDNFDSNIIVTNPNEHPPLLRLYFREDICLETVVILDNMTKCFSYWDKKLEDTIIYPRINKLVQDYKPFLNYDHGKMRQIVVNQFKQHTT